MDVGDVVGEQAVDPSLGSPVVELASAQTANAFSKAGRAAPGREWQAGRVSQSSENSTLSCYSLP
jgi:hypothetical protein